MLTLKNDHVLFSLDGRGRPTSLANLHTGRDWANPAGGAPWRSIWQRDEVTEIEFDADDPRVEFSAEQHAPDAATLVWRAEGPFACEIVAKASLEGPCVRFDIDLANRSADATLREFQFPQLKNAALRENTAYIDSANGGRRFDHPRELIREKFTHYAGSDHLAVEAPLLYPGLSSLNAYLLSEPGDQLYVASHDPSFQYTVHLLRGRGGERGCGRGAEIDLSMVKYPHLAPGESAAIEGYRLAAVAGAWTDAADLYKKWLATWRRPTEKPRSILDSNGWHRIIMRHQYGEIFFHADDLPRALDVGLAAGIDTVFLFGWWQGGMDSDNPEYRFDPGLGGHDGLKRRIAEFRAGGGRVILYYNGQLIDTASEFYRARGRKLSVKTVGGAEYTEQYRFGGPGTALRMFGNKVFVTACPACAEWLEVLKELVDRAVELGCDGVFFDQLGYVSQPCHDRSHGHRVPLMDAMRHKADMLRELYAHTKARAPDMSFGIEWLNDLTSQHVDFLHNIGGGANPRDFYEFSRYVLPDIVISDREIRDDLDIERRVNHALRLGLRSDVEIYRCRKLIDETPRYQRYLTQANLFRDRHRALILNGRFDADGGARCEAPPFLGFSVFRADGRAGAVLTNDSADENIETDFVLPGARHTGFDALGEATAEANADGRVRVRLSPHSLLLLLFDEAGALK